MPQLDSRLASSLAVQMNREMVAAVTYKQMRTDLRLAGWYGFHKVMHESEKEELQHARDFDHFLTERGIRPVYTTIQPEPILYAPDNPLYYFQTALDLEELFWSRINDLYQMSEDLDDPDTCKFLYKKIGDQHESVDGLNQLIIKMKRAEGNIAAMQMLDKKALDIISER